MTEDNNHSFSGMQQSVLKGTYIIGEVINSNDDYVSYNGFNLKTGKTAVILESRHHGQEDASIPLMKAFCKAHQDTDYSKEEVFFDDDILYVILKPEKRLQKNEGKRQEHQEFKSGVHEDVHVDRQSSNTDGKPKMKVVLPVLIAIVCIVILFIVIKSLGSNTENGSFMSVAVGDYITFGSYEQDNDTSNGKEDIEWLVLDKRDDKMLVISKYALDCQDYNETLESTTWETCSLRSWLNSSFIDSAFSADEQSQILTATVTADENPEYNTSSGNDTEDRAFLLSISEAEQYFDSDEVRMCAPTSYANAQGALVYDSYTTADGGAACYWWLRSPGKSSYNAAGVFRDGSINADGYRVDYSSAVRPALWINL